MFECEREVYSELSCASRCGSVWWVKEITFDVSTHGVGSITLTYAAPRYSEARVAAHATV